MPNLIYFPFLKKTTNFYLDRNTKRGEREIKKKKRHNKSRKEVKREREKNPENKVLLIPHLSTIKKAYQMRPIPFVYQIYLLLHNK